MARKTAYTFTLDEQHKKALEKWAVEDDRSASAILRRLIENEEKRRAESKTQNGFGK